ncbi:MAG: LysM peptidoglycan-binding domain-containing protein [Streptococcaceae bacterium]|jgi:LysM repeat protein|nr:LysM peptidoglycan-binding domain-containing protein [Streptococcaceae bacterium]
MVTRTSRKARRQRNERIKRNYVLKKGAKTAFSCAAVVSSISASLAAPTFTNEASAQTTAASRAQYIENLAIHAVPVANRNGLWASVMMAQAILESNWGQSGLSSPPHHNLFGVKGSFQGRSVTFPTREFLNGQWVTINAAFRSYPSFTQSFEDYAFVIRNVNFGSGPFYIGAWKAHSRSFRDATAWLQGRYATDPNYAALLNNIIVSNNLTRFDTMDGVGTGNIPVNNVNTGNNNNNNSNSSTSTSGTYRVVAGDTLSRIAVNFGTSVANLKSWNNLKSDLIFVGQTLQVQASGGTSTNNNTNTNTPTNQATHLVVSGDTLSALAIRYQTSVANIRSWNGLTSDMIRVGQVLRVSATGNTNTNNNANTSTSTNTNNQTNHTVVSGDTLSSLALRYNTSVANIRSWNNLNSDLIRIGQVLRVSATGSSTSTNTSNTPNTNANTSSASGQNYTIVSGDTLSAIALRFGTTVANLRSWNNINGDLIRVGQVIRVSSSGSVSNNTTNTPPSTNTYTVRSGDSLWAIAQANHTSVDNLIRLNNLRTDVIVIGQVLRLI